MASHTDDPVNVTRCDIDFVGIFFLFVDIEIIFNIIYIYIYNRYRIVHLIRKEKRGYLHSGVLVDPATSQALFFVHGVGHRQQVWQMVEPSARGVKLDGVGHRQQVWPMVEPSARGAKLDVFYPRMLEAEFGPTGPARRVLLQKL